MVAVFSLTGVSTRVAFLASLSCPATICSRISASRVWTARASCGRSSGSFSRSSSMNSSRTSGQPMLKSRTEGSFVEVLEEQFALRLRLERGPARQHLEHDAAEGGTRSVFRVIGDLPVICSGPCRPSCRASCPPA